MAQFKLVILTPHLINPETENPSVNYYRDIITDFNSQLSFKYGTEQEDIFDINTSQFYNYTYDETLTTNQNMQETLSFKMVKNLFNHKTNSWENNLYVKKIKNGTLIELIDNYNRSHWFTVNNISYTIKPNNTEISYSAISFFQSQMSKRETAYEIVNDPSSESFIGARNFQFWVEKILSECKTGYSYIPFEYEIFLRKNGDYCAKKDKKFYHLNDLTNAINTTETPITDLAYLVRKDLSDKKDSSGNIIKKGVDKTITFSLLGGTAENALITLGTEYGLIYEVDYKTKTIWFKEVKNSDYTGLSFSPNTNLQSLSVSQKADSLTTIFNVEGPEIAGEKISLLEAPTPLFLEWFSKPGSGWDDSIYYPGLYTDYVVTRGGSAADKHFAELAEKVPLLENKIFKSAYIQKVYNPSLYYQIENQIYNKLRINNGKLLCCRNILAQLTKEKVEFIGKYLEPACDTQGTLLYNHCFHQGEAPTDATFVLPNFNAIKLDEVITYYGNLYRESLQTFAKNLYELRDYWNNKLQNSWPENNPAEIYQLTQYWNNMYLAALKCDYAVQKELPEKEKLTAALNNLPVITIDNKNTYKIYTYYKSENTETLENWMSTFCNDSKYNSAYWHITLVPGREQVYYIISNLSPSETSPSKWKDRLSIEYGQGWYQNFIRGYLSHCSNTFESIYTQYSELIKTNQNIWADLYKNYGMLLLESSFTSSTATSSEELYNEAITYYAEYEKPQKQYSLTIIDLQVVHGYQQPLISIGDQIALQYNDFYQEEDDLKDLLEERLFINSISYTLRKDTDITYNVSTVSFYDKLLTKLAKLIH